MTASTAPVADSEAHRHAHRDPRQQQSKPQALFGFIPIQHGFVALTIGLLAAFKWPLRWLLSGAPLLTYSLLLGAADGRRVLAFLPLWTLVMLINLSYSVAATSWLLYWLFFTACYPAIFLSCLFQFPWTSRFVRKRLRKLLRELHFTNDTVAFFDLPALEIDMDVEGLMCIRGLAFSFSSLTIVAYGVEVGIKLTDDLEIALLVDKVTIQLFRRIEISDVYGNIKGGLYEMTFGKLAPKSRDTDGASIMVEDTPLLVAAAATGDMKRPGMIRKLTAHMTGGKTIEDTSVRSGLDSVRRMSADDDKASTEVTRLLTWIQDTSAINTCRQKAEEALMNKNGSLPTSANVLRAAICTQLHDKPTIPHPANKSIKVSTIQHLTRPDIRRFLHRLPLLLRCVLNPIAYFHPVSINSITVGGSGGFVQRMLQTHIFPVDSETGIKKLKQRISAWLLDANFIFQFADVTGQASVPINTVYDIVSSLTFDDVMAYRTLPTEVNLTEIIRTGGADARIAVPSFLLPHHEHLLPPPPTSEDEDALDKKKKDIEGGDDAPKEVQAQQNLERTVQDQANIKISAHVRLPTRLDQELLDFIAALVKATKIIEMERDNPVERETKGFKNRVKGLGDDMVDSMRRVAVDAAANDRWIAKLVGKVTERLETMKGELGYSGEFGIPMDPYRQNAEEPSKLMA